MSHPVHPQYLPQNFKISKGDMSSVLGEHNSYIKVVYNGLESRSHLSFLSTNSTAENQKFL